MLFKLARCLLVVYEMVDGGVLSADGALRIVLGVDGAELHLLGIEGEQAVGEQAAHAGEVFQRLGCLYGAEHAGYGSQYACLRTGGYGSCWGRFLEHASITRRAGQMGERLTLEAQYAAVGEGLASHDAGIVDEELHGEVVGAVNDEVILPDDVEGIGGVEELVVGVNSHIGVDGEYLLLGTVHLGTAYVAREVDDLTLQVAQVHHVGVDYAYGAYACCRKIERHGGSQSACTHDEHTRLHYLLLPLNAHVLKQYVARIALYLFFREVCHSAPPPMK